MSAALFLLSCALLVVLVALKGATAVSAQTPGATISSPTAGQVLQGQVALTGTAGGANFASGDLAFGYASDATDTWFLIQSFSQPVENAALATWDTTTITDGDYVLRLRVNTTDGAIQEAKVPVRIANYTAAEEAPATTVAASPPSLQLPTPLVLSASPTSAPPLLATPTQLASNPASIGSSAIYEGLWRGALAAAAAFVLLGALLLRRRS